MTKDGWIVVERKSRSVKAGVKTWLKYKQDVVEGLIKTKSKRTPKTFKAPVSKKALKDYRKTSLWGHSMSNVYTLNDFRRDLVYALEWDLVDSNFNIYGT